MKDNATLRDECISQICLDIVEIGGSAEVVSELRVVPHGDAAAVGGDGGDAVEGTASEGQLHDLIAMRIGSLFGDMINESQEMAGGQDALHIVGDFENEERRKDLVDKTKKKFMVHYSSTTRRPPITMLPHRIIIAIISPSPLSPPFSEY